MLRRHRQKPNSSDGHPGSTNRTPVTLAERTHRTPHRLDPPRMPGSRRGPGRGASSPDPQRLRRLLQSHPYPSCSREGRPSRPSRPRDWTSRGHPCSRWPASPIRPDGLIGRAHVEGRETWRVLEVTYPGDVPAHTKVQKLYFGDDFMLRRLDYVTDVLGGVAAHYCYDHVTIDGLVFPTLRRVVRRTPEGPLLSGRTSFILDYTALAVRK